jgi:hypothetical protein
MPAPDIWSDAPYGNYPYPLDSLLAGSDSLQQAETLRMLRDVYFSNVGTTQGANQFINLCNRASESWMPSMFSSESLALKILLLGLLAISCLLMFPKFRSKLKLHRGVHLSIIACLAILLLVVPLGLDYYVPICLTFLGVGILIVLVYSLVRMSGSNSSPWPKIILVAAVIASAFLNLTQPIPSFPEVMRGDNPVDTFFWVVCSAFLLFTVIAYIFTWEKVFESRKAASYSEKKNLDKQKLALWALCTWCFAFLIYFIGSYSSGTQRSLLTSLFRPALSACKIFLLADSVSEISLALCRSGLFMGLLTLARLSGFLVSAQLIISLLGERVKASIRMRFAHCIDSPLYVFLGINPASVQVAKTIDLKTSQTQGSTTSKPLIVFVDTAENDISTSRTTFGFGNFVSFFTHRHEAFEAVAAADRRELPALITIASTKLEDLSDDCNSLSAIALSNLERLIGEASQVEFFFLTDNEKANITGAKRLTDMLDKSCKGKYVIYSHQRRNSMSQLLQFDDIRIETVDSAQLTIDQLKNEPAGLLTDLVDFDEKGCCTSTLRSLVIGMGDTGEEAVRYLYEYGAFVNNEERRSDFECYVVDSKMKELEGSLYTRIPELENTEDKREPNVRAKLMQQKEGSTEFWNWLDNHIASLQFILISAGDAEAQTTLANEIYNLAVRHRPKQPQFPLRIFICATSNSSSELHLMAETYRKLNDYGNVELIPLGTSDKIFTYENITKRNERIRAEQYYNAYQKATAQLSDDQITWSQRRANAVADGSLASILEFLRMESQDISNEYHRRTKISIIQRALSKAPLRNDGHQYTIQDLFEALPESLTSDTDLKHLTDDDYLNTLIHNIAVLEHVRWNASHEIQGFQRDADVPRQLRSLLRKHRCLDDWSNLSYYTKLFDFAVVITTLKIEKDEK